MNANLIKQETRTTKMIMWTFSAISHGLFISYMTVANSERKLTVNYSPNNMMILMVSFMSTIAVLKIVYELENVPQCALMLTVSLTISMIVGAIVFGGVGGI